MPESGGSRISNAVVGRGTKGSLDAIKGKSLGAILGCVPYVHKAKQRHKLRVMYLLYSNKLRYLCSSFFSYVLARLLKLCLGPFLVVLLEC